MRRFSWTLPLLMLGLLAAAPAYAGNSSDVVVVTHIDMIPDSAGQAPPAALALLEQFVLDSRKDPGVEYFTLITWAGTTNHFQLLEVFRNMRAFDAHVSAAHTVAFRNGLQPYIGAPYDERLYQPASW
ncbi:MAG: putative quinol monooxygenase [Stellaceae bacterium]